LKADSKAGKAARRKSNRATRAKQAAEEVVHILVKHTHKSKEAARWNGQPEGQATYLNQGEPLQPHSPRKTMQEEVAATGVGESRRTAILKQAKEESARLKELMSMLAGTWVSPLADTEAQIKDD
jgi:hypothetical protein